MPGTADTTQARGPLTGIRVVEIASFIAGPYAGQLLADLGAEVVKVESPSGGDPFRSFAGGSYAPHFLAYNRNKRSVAVDLRSEHGATVARALVERADVLLENSRPGVMDRLGLDYETVRGWNPRLVYCSVSGFGQDGPAAERPVYDTVAQALGGMLSQTLDPDQPRITGPAMSDGIAGLTAAYAVLAALTARGADGPGQHVDVSMFAATAAFLTSEAAIWHATGDRGGPHRRPSLSQSYAFTCSDDRVITVHLSSPAKFWSSFVAAVERLDLLSDPRFATREARVENFEDLHVELAPVFRDRPVEAWREAFLRHDVPHAQVNSIEDVFAEPQAQHWGLELRLQHPTEGEVIGVAPPVRFSQTPWQQPTAPPTLGQDTASVLAELGLPAAPPEPA